MTFEYLIFAHNLLTLRDLLQNHDYIEMNRHEIIVHQ